MIIQIKLKFFPYLTNTNYVFKSFRHRIEHADRESRLSESSSFLSCPRQALLIKREIFAIGINCSLWSVTFLMGLLNAAIQSLWKSDFPFPSPLPFFFRFFLSFSPSLRKVWISSQLSDLIEGQAVYCSEHPSYLQKPFLCPLCALKSLLISGSPCV